MDTINSIKWWHTIELPEGTTPGKCPTEEQDWKASFIPRSLKGKSVIDIGAWDGLYSFECEKRGAACVLATDNFFRREDDQRNARGFYYAAEKLKSKVTFLEMDILKKSNLGPFDLVLFFGVLYHVKHPMLAIERVRDLCKPGGRVLLETVVINGKHPYLFFCKGKLNKKDPTNYWLPTPNCIKEMCEDLGLEVCGFEVKWTRGMFMLKRRKNK